MAIGEYKVITSNYKAEYDQISSAASHGRDEVRHQRIPRRSVLATYTDQDWRANTPTETADGKKTPSQEKEYGFALGGPIIQDQMHFFFTYEGKRFDTPIAVTPIRSPAFPISVGLLPAECAVAVRSRRIAVRRRSVFRQDRLGTRPTRDRFELSAKVRRENQADNTGVGAADIGQYRRRRTTTRASMRRWQHSADCWINER